MRGEWEIDERRKGWVKNEEDETWSKAESGHLGTDHLKAHLRWLLTHIMSSYLSTKRLLPQWAACVCVFRLHVCACVTHHLHGGAAGWVWLDEQLAGRLSETPDLRLNSLRWDGGGKRMIKEEKCYCCGSESAGQQWAADWNDKASIKLISNCCRDVDAEVSTETRQ